MNVYQLLPAPVDFRTAAYVRQSGEPGTVRAVPRVLLPLAVGRGGTVDLSAVRDADQPTRPATAAGRGPVLIWVEVRVADEARAGNLTGACDLVDGAGGEVLGSVPVTVGVADVSIAAVPGVPLAMSAELRWSAAAAADPWAFAGVTPRLLSRTSPTDAAAVAALDRYVRLAHDHGAALAVDRLQPVVKWPPGRPPAADWGDYDTVVGPWLDGSAFADRRPIGYMPCRSRTGWTSST